MTIRRLYLRARYWLRRAIRACGLCPDCRCQLNHGRNGLSRCPMCRR